MKDFLGTSTLVRRIASWYPGGQGVPKSSANFLLWCVCTLGVIVPLYGQPSCTQTHTDANCSASHPTSLGGVYVIGRGDLLVQVRIDNGAIERATFLGREYFRHGTNVSDWGLQLDSNVDTFQRNTADGLAQLPMTVSASDGIVVEGAYEPGDSSLNVHRWYQVPTENAVVIRNTFTNLSAEEAILSAFETFDPDQGASVGSGYETFNDVFLLDASGNTLLVGQATDTEGYSFVALTHGSGVQVASGFPFRIDAGSTLNGVINDPADGENTWEDQGTHVVFQQGIPANSSTEFVMVLGFGASASEALQAAVNALLACNAPSATVTGDQSVCGGTHAVVEATLTGSPPWTITWSDSIVQSGITENTVQRSVLVEEETAFSILEVRDANCVGVSSGQAVVTIADLPTILEQPVSSQACSGEPFFLTVDAEGAEVLGYQWRKDGIPITDATNSSFSIASVSNSDAGSYDCVVTNECGSVFSSAAMLTVKHPIAIDNQPNTTFTCPGGSATFTVVATGTEPIAYQWRKDGIDVPGATAATLTLSDVSADDEAVYDCVLTNTCGSITSAQATLQIRDVVSITQQPESQSVCAGSTATLTLSAAGADPLRYQWRKDGLPLEGATDPMLLLTAVTSTDTGSYDCLISNECGEIYSAKATVVILEPVEITFHPESQVACPGDTVTLTAAATGTEPLRFQWLKDGTEIEGATAAGFTLVNASSADAAQYQCRISNTCGADESNVAVLTIQSPIDIASHPVSQEVCPGAQASFSVTATGTEPLSYQWIRNGSEVEGATAASYLLDGVIAEDAAEYACVIRNECGELTSESALLTVFDPVVIETQPMDVTACPEETATFAVAAEGTAITYQWRHGGIDLPGATTASLTIDSVSSEHGGMYTCAVTNACGSETTAGAMLRVLETVSIASNPMSQTICPGEPTTFTVVAEGGQEVSYQWRQDSVEIEGATTSTFTIPSVVLGDSGEYDCLVSTTCNLVTSDSAVLDVDGALGIEPSTPTLAQGLSSVSLEAIVSCAVPPVIWEWENLNTGSVFGQNENPVVLEQLDESTSFQMTLMDTTETSIALFLVLVPQDPLFADFNEDGCNTLEDLWALAQFWRVGSVDANGDEINDVRDFLYIPIPEGEACP